MLVQHFEPPDRHFTNFYYYYYCPIDYGAAVFGERLCIVMYTWSEWCYTQVVLIIPQVYCPCEEINGWTAKQASSWGGASYGWFHTVAGWVEEARLGEKVVWHGPLTPALGWNDRWMWPLSCEVYGWVTALLSVQLSGTRFMGSLSLPGFTVSGIVCVCVRVRVCVCVCVCACVHVCMWVSDREYKFEMYRLQTP